MLDCMVLKAIAFFHVRIIVLCFGRIDIGRHGGSLLEGVEPDTQEYRPPRYCQCERHQSEAQCGVSFDVDQCDLEQGQQIEMAYFIICTYLTSLNKPDDYFSASFLPDKVFSLF